MSNLGLTSAISTQASCIKVKSPLDDQIGGDIIHCKILSLKNGQLVYVTDDKIEHLANGPCSNAKKIVVHHEFYPLKRFIVVLSHDGLAWLLSECFKETLATWEGICDILSEDGSYHNLGIPKLILIKESGARIVVNPFTAKDVQKNATDDVEMQNDFSLNFEDNIDENRLERDATKEVENESPVEAVTALLAKSWALLQRACWIQGERILKENFISRQLRNWKKDLSQPANQTTTLKVHSVRHKIVNSKWVVCIAVSNTSDVSPLSDLELHIGFEAEIPPVQYEVRMFRTYNRRPKHTASTQSNDTSHNIEMQNTRFSSANCLSIDEETVVRCGKRCFLIAVLDLPLCPSPLIKANALLSHKMSGNTFQTEVQWPTLDFRVMSGLTGNPLKECGGNGTSLDLLCLIATLVKYPLKVQSLVGSCSDDLNIRLMEGGMTQVERLDHIFVFNAAGNVLNNTVIIFKPSSTSKYMSLDLYAQNDNQAIVLLHWLSGILSKDEYCTSATSEQPSTINNQAIEIRNLNALTDAIKTIESVESRNNRAVVEKPHGGMKRGRNESADGSLSWNDYRDWRLEIHNILVKLESLS